MELRHVSSEYQHQLKDLATLLCPLSEVVEVSPLSVPREEPQNRWDSLGNYMTEELK